MPTVKMTIDPDRPPKISRQDLARFDAIKDEAIDYSDIPELGEDFFVKTRKESITARFDADSGVVQGAGEGLSNQDERGIAGILRAPSRRVRLDHLFPTPPVQEEGVVVRALPMRTKYGTHVA